MQGAMINDFSAVTESKIPQGVVGPKPQAQPEQPFGEILGTEMVEECSGCKAETQAAPFFMAALFDQSAAFVEPSENSGLIEAAERVQELIGQWLQNQTETPVSDSQSTLQVSEEPVIENILTVALDVLDRVDALDPQDNSDIVMTQPALGQQEIEELRHLMAVMMQSDEVRASLQNSALMAEWQQQVDKTVLRTEGQEVVSAGFQKSELAPAAAVVQPEVEELELVPTEAKIGLHEGHLARMLRSRSEHSAQPEQRDAKLPIEVEQLVVSGPAVDSSMGLSGDQDVACELTVEAVKAGLQPVSTNHQTQQGGQINVENRFDPLAATTAPKIMQLPSGLQLSESHLVDQVVTHLAGSSDGESGRMRLRLHPAELGSIRLDLIVEGDRLRAHLQAQTQQVQEVLDRHLPQLREALQQQGLKIDEFRVDVQTEQDQPGEQRFAWGEQQQGHSPQSPWLKDDWQQNIEIPLEQLLQQTQGGISLRV